MARSACSSTRERSCTSECQGTCVELVKLVGPQCNDLLAAAYLCEGKDIGAHALDIRRAVLQQQRSCCPAGLRKLEDVIDAATRQLFSLSCQALRHQLHLLGVLDSRGSIPNLR